MNSLHLSCQFGFPDRHEVDKLDEIVHDKWIYIDDLEIVKGSTQLIIAFWDKKPSFTTIKKMKVIGQSGRIIIKRIKSISIKDIEAIGFYDINEFVFNESNKSFSINTNIPLQFDIAVDGIDIEIEWG